jgi:hypothetical protein
MTYMDTHIDNLTSEQLEQFQRDGYVVIKAAFSRDAAKACEKAVLEILEKEQGVDLKAPVKPRFLVERRANPVFDKMVTPRLTKALDRLLGKDGWDRQHFTSHGDFFVTFPGFFKDQRNPLRLVGRWHVDLGFRAVEAHDLTDRNCAFVPAFFLTESKKDGACTLVASGSHRVVARLLGSVRQPIRRQEMVAFCESYVSRRAGKDSIVQLVGDAGDVVVMHPLLMHAASANGRDAIRIMGNTGVGGVGKRKIATGNIDRSAADEAIWQEIKSIRHGSSREFLLKLFLSLNRYFWTIRYKVQDKWKAEEEPKKRAQTRVLNWRALPNLVLKPICTGMTSTIFRLIGP